MKKKSLELHLEGVPLSEGVAIGKLFFLSEEDPQAFPAFSINSDEVDREIQRYRVALSSSRKDLEQLQGFLSEEGSQEAITIINTHIQMLEDPLITTIVEEKIQQMLQNTETVFRSVIGDYEKKFFAIEDVFFRQRWIDVKDLSQRILKHLYPKQESQMLPAEAVVFTKELTPSHTAEACVSKVCAFVSEIGGNTSHAALIARAKGIPYVAHIDVEALEPAEGSIVIVDGLSGKVILNPAEDTLQSYQKLKEDIVDKYQKLVEEIHIHAKTKDDKKIAVMANIEKLSDLDHPYFKGADGIGLFRSEFLFLQKELFSISEQDQYHAYAQMIRKAGSLPIVFRVFDLGGDKGFLEKDSWEEPNPALGVRGIRFLLHYREFFRRQLRALLRAIGKGNVSLLLPMIADIEELHEVKMLIAQVQEELLSQGLHCAQHVPIGCMIEVPSAALTCDILAKECDFFSIGTNDLVQYTLAIDRSHPVLSHGFKPTHPSILRMIRHVIHVSMSKKKHVTVCGEMASNPLFTKLLVGLGIEQLSCAPRHIPLIKKTIRSFSYTESKDLVEKLLLLDSAKEVEGLLMEHHEKYISV
jgi:phosphotransferase system enzyme I (PtsI)